MTPGERIARSWRREVIRTTVTHANLCPRTNCYWKRGVPVPGVHCVYAYTGSMPCTGSQRCLTCGGLKP